MRIGCPARPAYCWKCAVPYTGSNRKLTQGILLSASNKAWDGAMARGSDPTVEGLAKQFAELDAFEWRLEFKLPLPARAKPVLGTILDDTGRERYRTVARHRLDQAINNVQKARKINLLDLTNDGSEWVTPG